MIRMIEWWFFFLYFFLSFCKSWNWISSVVLSVSRRKKVLFGKSTSGSFDFFIRTLFIKRATFLVSYLSTVDLFFARAVLLSITLGHSLTQSSGTRQHNHASHVIPFIVRFHLIAAFLSLSFTATHRAASSGRDSRCASSFAPRSSGGFCPSRSHFRRLLLVKISDQPPKAIWRYTSVSFHSFHRSFHSVRVLWRMITSAMDARTSAWFESLIEVGHLAIRLPAPFGSSNWKLFTKRFFSSSLHWNSWHLEKISIQYLCFLGSKNKLVTSRICVYLTFISSFASLEAFN